LRTNQTCAPAVAARAIWAPTALATCALDAMALVSIQANWPRNATMTNRKVYYIGPIVVIGLCGALVMVAWEKRGIKW
jgi:membrane-bound metal-dependent hydrolase YbcI (DUF457 family)